MNGRELSWGVLAAAALAFTAAQGCNAIAGLDAVKFEGDGTGGGGTGGGGLGGGTTTAGGTGGTGGAMCVDPATDCTDALSGECKMWTCDTDGVCAEADVPNGMDATTQTAGDCKKNVCMTGAVASENDDADVLDDMNECTVDSCLAGAPQIEPAAVSAMCAMDGGKVCNGMSACVECLTNADCTDIAKPICSVGNTCIEATCDDMTLNGTETDVDCGGGCTPCDTGKICDVDGDCYHDVCDDVAKTCTAPTCTDNTRNGGMYLGDDGETDVDCGGPCGATCGPMKVCDENTDCVGNQCTGMGGTCVPNCADTVKNNAETDTDCGGGACGGCAVGNDCGAMDANCVATAYCNMGVCVAKQMNGTMCMGNNQCTSAFCVDMVCCNLACNGTCQACDLAGSVGSCDFISAGTDPANECNGNGGTDVCDGSGACAEANGTACAAGPECASGNCVDGVCCDTPCAGTCQACSMALTGGANGVCGGITAGTDPGNECSASLDCNGSGACEAQLANGAACTVTAECSSGNCIDGVCCNTACGGLCQACTMAKKGTGADGTCGPVTVDTDPDNECLGALYCNGLSACNKADGDACGAAGECQSNFCVDGVCCDTACDAPCKACNVAGMGGVCSYAADGMQDLCLATEVCDTGVCITP